MRFVAYLSGLRFIQITSGLPDLNLPSFPQLQYVLRGVQRCHSTPRLPITSEVMQILWSNPEMGSCFDRSMWWAACCLGFFGVMRSGKFTCTSLSHFQDHMLSPRDISVHSQTQPSVISILLRRSKTDTFGRGMSVFWGQTSHTICPVAAIPGYLELRGIAHGPLFIHRDSYSLSRQRLVTVIGSALQSQGVD